MTQPSSNPSKSTNTPKQAPSIDKKDASTPKTSTGGMKDEGGSCATSSSSKTTGCN